MPEYEENVSNYCEKCDRESKHLIKFVGPDNLPHYICWECLQQEEKRIIHKPEWKRMRRAS